MQEKKLPDSWYTDFFNRIRKAVGDNPAEFSRISGINDRTLRKYIRGKDPAIPGADKLKQISEKSNTSSDYLLFGDAAHGVISQDSCIMRCNFERLPFYKDLETILNSGDDGAISAIKAALKGAKVMIEDKDIQEINKKLDTLLEIHSGLGETKGVTPRPGKRRSRQRK
jgi:transcriptional regulator with XRE-family HTH domain